MQEHNKAGAIGAPAAAEGASGMGRLIIIDIIVMAVVLAGMYLLRFKSGLIGFRPGSEGYRDVDYYIFLPCGIALWALSIYVVRGYEADARRLSAVGLTRLVTGTVLAFLLIGVGDAMARASIQEWNGISRNFMLLSVVSGLAALAAVRMLKPGKGKGR